MNELKPIPKLIPKEGVTTTLAGGRRARIFPNGSIIDEATGEVIKGTAPAGQQSEVSLRSPTKFGHLPYHTVSATAKKLVDYPMLVRSVIIQNDLGNGVIYVGGEGVSSDQYAIRLGAGGSTNIDVSDPSTIYLVGTAGNKVRVGYTQ